MPGGPATAEARVAWVWRDAALGALYALPAGIVAAEDPRKGAALAVGVLPAAIVGLAPARRARLSVLIVGALFALALLTGSGLAKVPVVAVAGIFLAGVGAVALARVRPRLGQMAMALALPVVGIGFSYDDVAQAAGIAALILAGSAYACAVALLWPEQAPAAAPAAATPVPPSLDYGVRLGGAGATAAAIGFALELDHVGWTTAAALFVMRPAAELQRLRSVGRIAAVASGASLAVLVVSQHPGAGWFAALVVLAVSAAAATRTSRWYISGGFTTFLVFVLLLYADPAAAGSRLGERIGETVLGVAIAYAFGLGIPLLRRVRTRRQSEAG